MNFLQTRKALFASSANSLNLSKCIINTIKVRYQSTQTRSKVVNSVDEALDGVKSNITLLSGGFGLSGLPEMLINGLLAKKDINGITAVSNNAGIDKRGLSNLLESGQITKMISSYIGNNKTFEKLYLSGKIDLELCPQGNLAERCRAGAAGIPAYYTATGVNTWIEEGKLPVRYDPNDNTKVLKTSKPRESRVFNGKKYLLEEAIVGDVAFVKAFKADTLGNCWFKGSARNFNSVFGRAANLTIVEAENIVEPGEIQAEDVHLPGLYVDRIIQSNSPKDIEILTLSKDESTASDAGDKQLSPGELKRIKIVKRASQEFEDGVYANLGIGMPTLAPNYLPKEIEVNLQSENGILGMGPYPKPGEEDADLINAGKETVTLKPGASLFGSEESFAMIRSGKISLTMLGGLQVSKYGDLANWGLPGRIKGMGGAMDLVSSPERTKVVVLMEHVDKKGRPKILDECKFPLTGAKCVSRIITDLAVFDVDSERGLTLIEIDGSSTVEEVRAATGCEFAVSLDLKTIEV
ncbi:3-oxoacid CoA-transferase [Ascoidea rubescens DSM 1968]|uniref:Succinyl-CoA:3-ketoacid-coenzyme A transferase n=1 Tax=Ascoidea rubescens DSM 1968 TaxID=1344418 RepID=A0A1D2VKB5_9ASCO|nr:3-oxoacid coa-transferase [Ascoidea rubescens DSM 1968]ODV61967.1 3-oxoacid coa-transferase [Ascoidea rubescens DSM 1968]